MIKDKFKSLHESIEQAFDHLCCVCTNPIIEGEVKHKIIDRDNFTWTICDDCWQHIKNIMDQDE